MNENGSGIMPVMPIGNNGDFGNSSFFWVFALLLLGMGGFGGNGWGNGNGNSNAIQNDINRGFDNQNLQAQTRDILSAVTSGTAQTVAATNQSFHDTLNAMQSLYGEMQRDIAANAVSLANLQGHQTECCCNTLRAIDSVGSSTQAQIAQSNYDGAMRDAATNANITAQIQSVKDMINSNTIQGLRDQVDSLRDQVNMAGVLRFPNSWSYGAGPFPPIFGGCGCNA